MAFELVNISKVMTTRRPSDSARQVVQKVVWSCQKSSRAQVPATVVDPRPLRLGKYVERHRLGLYQPRRRLHRLPQSNGVQPRRGLMGRPAAAGMPGQHRSAKTRLHSNSQLQTRLQPQTRPQPRTPARGRAAPPGSLRRATSACSSRRGRLNTTPTPPARTARGRRRWPAPRTSPRRRRARGRSPGTTAGCTRRRRLCAAPARGTPWRARAAEATAPPATGRRRSAWGAGGSAGGAALAARPAWSRASLQGTRGDRAGPRFTTWTRRVGNGRPPPLCTTVFPAPPPLPYLSPYRSPYCMPGAISRSNGHTVGRAVGGKVGEGGGGGGLTQLVPLLSKTVWRAVEGLLLTLKARRAVEQASLVVGMHPDQVRRASSPSRARPGAMRDPPCSHPEN